MTTTLSWRRATFERGKTTLTPEPAPGHCRMRSFPRDNFDYQRCNHQCSRRLRHTGEFVAHLAGELRGDAIEFQQAIDVDVEKPDRPAPDIVVLGHDVDIRPEALEL